MPPLIWLLRMLLLSFNIVSSFKALKPVLRKRRSSQEPKNLSSADRARRRAIKEQLICWVVFIAFAWGEKLADRTLAWVVPFYSQVKLVLLFFMLAWRSTGSQIIFKKAIKPLVLPYERPVDAVGYILNEVIQLVLAALLFVPRRVGQWWQGKAREPDIPSILVGLRSPHRPPLARTLADSIESAQARSDAEVNKRFSRPIVTSKPEPAPTPVAPKSTLRRPPSTTSLSASTSQRPSAVPFRPIRPTNSREHLSLSASTSRLPRTSNGDASSSRLGASSSVYPSLSASQGLSEVWGTSRASTSRPLVPSSSFKGKQRETFDPLAVPSPPSSSLHGSRRFLNNSTAPPVPIHLGRSSSAARNSLAIPQPRPPSPPSPQHSPPRDEARAPLVPPTPAPPGAFHTSFAAPSPPRLPRPAAVAYEEQKIPAGSPRAKASSAIAGLAMEMDGGLSGGLAFGSAKKKKARDATTDVETGRKRVRRGEAEVKPKAAPRKARRRLQDSDEEEGEEEDSEDEYVEEKPEIQKATSPKKRKAPARELQEETSATETEDRVASSSRKLATSTRRTATSAIKPAAASSSRVASKTSIPLTATRSRLSHSTRVALDSIPTSAPTTDDDGDSHRPATLPKKSARTGASSSTVVAPTRKARRVLGRAGQQEAEQEVEVDGVPVVRRRTARR